MKRPGWIAIAVAALLMVGCGETTPTRQQLSDKGNLPQVLDYQTHPWTDAISLWHRDDLTTTELRNYEGFIMNPVVMAQEGQMMQPNVQAVNADIIQTPFPAMMASAMHPLYELEWEAAARRMKMQIVVLAASKKPMPGEEVRYLPITMNLNAVSNNGDPLIKRITIAATALRIDLMDASTDKPLLSILDHLEEVKAAWRQEPDRPVIDLEQLMRHWMVKVRYNLEALQPDGNQSLRNAG